MGPPPSLTDLQNLTQTQANEVGRAVMPLFSAMLILARKPGNKLSMEEEAKFSEALPAPAVELLKTLVEIIPEDPEVTQLKHIAGTLEAIEAKLNAGSAAASASAPENSSSAPPTSE